jgi:acyl-CoA reductase-like NAD-dependent aldehyde dehydrogenase
MNDVGSPSVREVKIWINGEAKDAQSGATFVDNNPDADTPFAQAARAEDADVKAAVEAAHAAFATYRMTLPREREAWLIRMAALLEAAGPEVTDLLVKETGSPMNKAQFELAYSISHLRAASGIPRRLVGQTLPSDTPGRFSMALREPLGVFACITPFNVPLIKIMKQATGPLATGNTVVALASEETPVLSVRIAQLFSEAGFPAGALNMITGYGHEIGDGLVTHPLVKAVNFTGSTRVGRHLSGLCGQHMKRGLFELGGKNPFIVLKDADLDAAAMGATMGMFLFQGQA